MQLGRFEWFVKRVKTDSALMRLAGSIVVYRLHDRVWFNEEGQQLSDSLLKRISRFNDDAHQYWRARAAKECLFSVGELRAVVAATFPAVPKLQTQRRFFELLNECCKNSKNEYDAQHDQLTSLFNRVGFETALLDVILNARTAAVSVGSPMEPQKAVALLALDIDHFKQVNDSYGHQYGDGVLVAFAWRLTQIADSVKTQHQAKVIVARATGGEEFFVLIDGLKDQTQVLEVANQFLTAIGKDELPTNAEWTVIAKDLGLGNYPFPPTTERRITTSIGHAALPRIDGSVRDNELRSYASALIREADAALYRAKNDGRACVRSFREIRDRLGHVIEHHAETNVVTIDIGSGVGVMEGNEFLLFHPQFTGDAPFFFTDGRTRRRLGTYPRYSSGRITVFKVDREISFCHVLDQRGHTPFPVGARLEYVPLGSITHLVTQGPGIPTLPVVDYRDLQSRVSSLNQGNTNFAVIVIALAGLSEIARRHGVVAANETLASLYRSMKQNCPLETVIGGGQVGEFIALLMTDESTSNATLTTILERIINSQKAVGPCKVGVFVSEPTTREKFSKEHAIEFARLASHTEGTIEIFGASTSESVVKTWRKYGKYEEAIADYLRFREYGISTPLLDNLAGLCYYESPQHDYPLAIECFSAAIRGKPGDRILNLNLALAMTMNRNYEEAYKTFSPYHDYLMTYIQTESEPFVGYLAAYAASAMETRKNGTSLQMSDDVLKGVVRAAIDRASTSIAESLIKEMRELLN